MAKKDIENNVLWVVQGHDHPWLQSLSLTAQEVSWVAGHAPENLQLAAKTRYRQTDASCAVHNINTDHIELKFTHAQWAVTPGQSAVLYDGEICLGGGIITKYL